jgi:hypothetical protein
VVRDTELDGVGVGGGVIVGVVVLLAEYSALGDLDKVTASVGVSECVWLFVGDDVGETLTEFTSDADLDGDRVRFGVTVTDAGSADKERDFEVDAVGSFVTLAWVREADLLPVTSCDGVPVDVDDGVPIVFETVTDREADAEDSRDKVNPVSVNVTVSDFERASWVSVIDDDCVSVDVSDILRISVSETVVLWVFVDTCVKDTRRLIEPDILSEKVDVQSFVNDWVAVTVVDAVAPSLLMEVVMENVFVAVSVMLASIDGDCTVWESLIVNVWLVLAGSLDAVRDGEPDDVPDLDSDASSESEWVWLRCVTVVDADPSKVGEVVGVPTESVAVLLAENSLLSDPTEREMLWDNEYDEDMVMESDRVGFVGESSADGLLVSVTSCENDLLGDAVIVALPEKERDALYSELGDKVNDVEISLEIETSLSVCDAEDEFDKLHSSDIDAVHVGVVLLLIVLDASSFVLDIVEDPNSNESEEDFDSEDSWENDFHVIDGDDEGDNDFVRSLDDELECDSECE